MYCYEYESVDFTLGSWDLGIGNAYVLRPDYREIIDARAESGWRFVGYIPSRQRENDHMVDRIDLIFEKEV